MKWIRKSDSVQAAQIRTMLKKPGKSDDKILQVEVDRILSDRQDDGSLGDGTTGKLIRLSRLGCSPARPEVRAAAKHIFGAEERSRDGLIGVYGLYVAEWVGHDDHDLIARSARKLASHVMTMSFWRLCPWGGQVHTRGLWSGRKHADVTPALERGLNVMLTDVDERKGWPTFLDPFGYLDAAGAIDHPLSGQITRKQIPLILRTQQFDSSWGGMKHLGYGPDSATYVVLRALIKWDLLDELRKLPPLPPDWEVVRSVPVPEGDLSMLASGGDRLWFYDKATGEAVGVSAEDGAEKNRVKLPDHVRDIGWQDGRLAVVRVVKFVENNWDVQGVVLLDVDGDESPREEEMKVWKGAPWNINDFYGGPPVIQKGGEEPDWGEAPFGTNTAGVAWDGENLWVLDGGQRSICLVRKTESGSELTAAAPEGPGRGMMTVARHDKPHDIPRIKGAQAGSDWSEHGSQVRVLAQLNRGIPQFGADDGIDMYAPVPAEMSLAWNDDALMVSIQAKDDCLVEADDDLDAWRRKGDCVFLDIAPKPDVAAYWRIAIAPGVTAQHQNVRVFSSRSLIRPSESPFQAPFDRVESGKDASVQVKRTKIDGGYVLDVRVPWKRLDVKPEVGRELGLQVFVMSRSTVSRPPFRVARWCPRSRPLQDGFATERVVLAKKAAPPVDTVIEDGPRGLDIAVTAAGKYAGKYVTVLSGKTEVAKAALMADERSDYAIGSIPMPLSVKDPATSLRVMLDGRCIGELQQARDAE